MENTHDSVPGELSRREAGFLDRLSKKYESDETKGLVRSYLIASVVILLLFSAARWIPWTVIALLLVETLGLYLFHQYKRFARFKTGMLVKLWQQAKKVSE